MKKYLIITSMMVAAFSLKAQTLDDYFKEAAEKNPGLLSKYKEFESSMERVPQVTTLNDPSLSLGYFISPVETRVGPQRARISLTQMFPWFGTLKTSGDVAALNAEAKYQSFMDARNQLYVALASAFYPMYEIQNKIDLDKENLSLLSAYKSIAINKFENGEGTLVDVLRVDLMIKEAETEIEVLQKEKAAFQARFNNLMNRDLDEVVVLPESLSLDAELIITDSTYINNPAIKEIDMKIEASSKQTILAEKKGLPNIGLGLDYLLVGKRIDIAPGAIAQTDDGKDAFMPMVTISLPIFRSKYSAAKKEAELMLESYSLEREDRINSLSSRFEISQFESSQQKDLMKLYDDQIEETRQILNLLLSGYQNSGDDFEELLRTEQLLIKFKKQKAIAWTKYHLAQTQLQYLSGNIPAQK